MMASNLKTAGEHMSEEHDQSVAAGPPPEPTPTPPPPAGPSRRERLGRFGGRRWVQLVAAALVGFVVGGVVVGSLSGSRGGEERFGRHMRFYGGPEGEFGGRGGPGKYVGSPGWSGWGRPPSWSYNGGPGPQQLVPPTAVPLPAQPSAPVPSPTKS
jgi:hypothetical protein